MLFYLSNLYQRKFINYIKCKHFIIIKNKINYNFKRKRYEITYNLKLT